jgi:hypothetical protein
MECESYRLTLYFRLPMEETEKRWPVLDNSFTLETLKFIPPTMDSFYGSLSF